MSATPLWNAEAEVELLATTMYSPEHCGTAFERLTPDHFVDPVHSRIWEAISALRSAGSLVDPHGIGHRLGADEGFAAWGGIPMLIDIIEKGSPPAITSLTDVLSDLQIRRSLEALSRDISARARDTSDATGHEILADFEREASAIAQRTNFSTAWTSAGEMLARAIEAARHRDGTIRYPTGIRDLDAKLGGLNAGETTALAAWTGMGKTIAGLQIAKANGQAGKGVTYFSLEMSEAPMAMRMACDFAYDRSAPAYSGDTTNLTINRALWGQLNPAEIRSLIEAQRAIDALPIFFDTRPNLTVAQIKAATIRQHRVMARHGVEPGPVIIDHIGKIKPTTDRRGNVTAETRDVCNDLDAMAKDLGVPVVALSQLNRQDQGANGSINRDRRPSLSSIKDSGVLAENARQVIFIYRPEYYHREPFEHEEFDAKAERLAELAKVRNHFYWLIEKNSNGPLGQVLSYCKADCSAVRDWTPWPRP